MQKEQSTSKKSIRSEPKSPNEDIIDECFNLNIETIAVPAEVPS
jgi:hypothetical protein